MNSKRYILYFSIVIIAIMLIFALQTNKSSQSNSSTLSGFVVSTTTWDLSSATGSLVDASWKTLTNNALGIRVKVPQKITTYTSLDYPRGCSQSLVLGIASGTSVFLAPQFSSCDKDGTSNIDRFQAIVPGFGTSPSEKLTVMPVSDLAEIGNALQERARENLLVASSSGNVADYQEAQCELQVSNITVPDIIPGDDSTVPVSVSSPCPSRYPITMRYSPQFKKLVFIEQGPDAIDDFGYVTESIYGSIEIFK